MRAERPDFLTHSQGGRKASLPVPDAAAQAHSALLLERIRAEIQAAGGVICFRRYMEMALYTPGLGYYMAGQNRLGADGDFVTAPEMGSVLGSVLARVLAPLLPTDAHNDGMLEFGAGRGFLAQQIQQCLPMVPYTMLELSPICRHSNGQCFPQSIMCSSYPRTGAASCWPMRCWMPCR
jgi:Uncharacterized conserved protein